MHGKIMVFLRLIRIPNLLIIVLTMFLIRYSIIDSSLYADDPDSLSSLPDFILLVLGTVLLAVGGYVINDYFDIRIDEINKPDQQIIHRLVPAKSAVKIHIVLNIIAVLIGFYLGYRLRLFSFAMIFPVISVMLWFYSARYKSMLVWGNLVVAILSAMVVVIVWMFEFFWLRLQPEVFSACITDLRWVTGVVAAYALFAFLITMVREVIKDIEDRKGDASAGCRTIPLVMGINNTRWILLGIVLVTMALLGYCQMILFRLNLMMPFWYLMVTVQGLLLFFLVKLFIASTQSDYHFLSILIKVIMVAGILSMQLLSLH